MKIDGDLKLNITRIEEATDYDGCVFLKCKGFNLYKGVTAKGRKINSYNQFSTIRLYPINQEQYEETKNRLFSQTSDKPILQIVAYQCDLTTNAIGGVCRPILSVFRYDFVKEKLFKRKKLLNYIGENNE